MTEEQRKYIALFRLEGLRLDWCVYFALYYTTRREQALHQIREAPERAEYFRHQMCNLLDEEMKAALKELQG